MKLLLLALLVIQALPFAKAVEVQQGTLYSENTRIESSALGLAFTIPPGWQGAWPSGSELFVLESAALGANVFVYIDQAQEPLEQALSRPMPLDENLNLVPSGKPLKRGQAWLNDFSLSGREDLSARVVARVSSGNLLVAFIGIAQVASAEAAWPSLDHLSSGLTFSQPKPAASDKAQGNGSWQDYMRGRHIVRFYTGSGYSEKEEIWLCSDGSFATSGNSGGFGGGASGAFGHEGQGQWSATGSLSGSGTLVLQYGAGSEFQGNAPGFDWQESGPGGERSTYRLELANNKLYLNGTQWLRDNNEYCR